MNQPSRPKDPPADGAPLDHDPTGTTPNGIPKSLEEAEPKGRPTSDRAKTETAAS